MTNLISGLIGGAAIGMIIVGLLAKAGCVPIETKERLTPKVRIEIKESKADTTYLYFQ